jgi:predicted RNase H-like HicB family nuclease
LHLLPSHLIIFQAYYFNHLTCQEKLNKSYRIVLEKDEDGRVVVRSPDLQGVVTDGADENEAIKNAFEAVEAILGREMGFNLIITHKHSV